MFPRRYVHLVYGVLQSGLTSGVASGIASLPLWASGQFWQAWITAWALAWLTMLPLVVFAAPLIQRLAYAMTRSSTNPDNQK